MGRTSTVRKSRSRDTAGWSKATREASAAANVPSRWKRAFGTTLYPAIFPPLHLGAF